MRRLPLAVAAINVVLLIGVVAVWAWKDAEADRFYRTRAQRQQASHQLKMRQLDAAQREARAQRELDNRMARQAAAEDALQRSRRKAVDDAARADALAAEVATLRRQLDARKAHRARLRTELDEITARIRAIDAAREGAIGDAKEANAERTRLETQLLELRRGEKQAARDLRNLSKRVKELDELWSLTTTGRRGHTPEPMMPDIKAKVLAVTPGQVVLNVGKDQKVQKGFKFTIFRGSNYIGQVYVLRVEKGRCTARIETSMLNGTIQVGDKAQTNIK